MISKDGVDVFQMLSVKRKSHTMRVTDKKRINLYMIVYD
jgi:hypothetical protein